MAKKSPAKIKKLAAQAKRTAQANRESKQKNSQSEIRSSDYKYEKNPVFDSVWYELGIGAPASKALIEQGLFKVADLRKFSLSNLRELEGMGPNVIRILVAEAKKSDITFRK
jgi:predicted flap endonuclease-1-like 5' DNA nuclease